MLSKQGKFVPTGIARSFPDNEFIVSKTDIHGKITYANEIFCQIAGYSEAEVLGKPHSLVRHPDMPRCVFQLLWDSIRERRDIFAYVKNMARGGDHYWVFAHVTPTIDRMGALAGFHSNRRAPTARAVETMELIYRRLREIEAAEASPTEAIAASTRALMGKLDSLGVNYDEFVMSL